MVKRITLLFLAWVVPALAYGAPITSLVVFGDSLSDQGNGRVLTGDFPPAPYAARASNGPVGVEYLADRLGLPLLPAAVPGGTNYAVVGATTGPLAIPGSSPPAITDNLAAVLYGEPALSGTGILKQVLSFVASGPVADPGGTLFVVWGGPNDFFIDASAAAAGNAVANLATAISLLYGNGARRFLVPNLPDLSITPFGRGLPSEQQAGLQLLSVGFNLGLASALDGLAVLPGIDIARFDTFGLLTVIAASPVAFGFTNATDPCATGSLGGVIDVCADPSGYVFWDTVHPTTAAHHVLGDRFAAAVVPEPATFALLGLGLAFGVVVRRAR
jgi:phospholipase/lecithinase/hemolysin